MCVSDIFLGYDALFERLTWVAVVGIVGVGCAALSRQHIKAVIRDDVLRDDVLMVLLVIMDSREVIAVWRYSPPLWFRQKSLLPFVWCRYQIIVVEITFS